MSDFGTKALSFSFFSIVQIIAQDPAYQDDFTTAEDDAGKIRMLEEAEEKKRAYVHSHSLSLSQNIAALVHSCTHCLRCMLMPP